MANLSPLRKKLSRAPNQVSEIKKQEDLQDQVPAISMTMILIFWRAMALNKPETNCQQKKRYEKQIGQVSYDADFLRGMAFEKIPGEQAYRLKSLT